MSRKIAWSSALESKNVLDEKFFVSLYEQLHPELITYGIKICRDEDVVLDSIHEVFLDLWEKKDKLHKIDDLKPYILRALRNQIISYLRTQIHIEQVNHNYLPLQISFAISHEELMIRTESQEIDTRRVVSLLSTLTDHQREVIFLKYYSGLGDKEIAAVMGMQHQSVRNQLSKTLKKLREAVLPVFLALSGI